LATSTDIPSRMLGPVQVGAIGVGCMAMTNVYGPFDEDEAVSVISKALDRGASMIDTAEVYGPFTNEELVGRAIAGRRDEVVISSKCGLSESEPGSYKFVPNGRPEYIHNACDGSLRRLGVDHIDIYYQHRLDVNVPIEDTLGAYVELIEAGKIGGIGLCEIDVATLQQATAVCPIASVQAELSLWTREQLDDLVPWCGLNGIGFVPYAPLGRGFLTGRYRSASDFKEGDFRASNPRFEEDALRQNLRLVDLVGVVAERHGATPGQIALAWVLAQGQHVVPIPGMEKLAYLDENLGAVDVSLTDSDLADLDSMPSATGSRY
jgi:aryl-alcohol dehydrogenase-like predicted oxidoreductase